MTMCAATAHADVVTDWNQIKSGCRTARTRLTHPTSQSRLALLNDRPLRVRVHRRYRVIAEVARGRPVVEVADRAGCHLSMAYEWIHRFNASGFTTFAQAPNPKGRPRPRR
jgi:hypothetical protein